MSYLDDLKWDNGEGVEAFPGVFDTIHSFAEFIHSETSQLKFWGKHDFDVERIHYMAAVILDYTDDLNKCVHRMMEERKSGLKKGG